MSKAVKKPGHHAARYPWERWFASRTPVVLLRGTDYLCTSWGMHMNCRQAGKRHGVKLHIQVEADRLTMMVMGKPDGIKGPRPRRKR